jgi:hypothetical protein
MVFAKVPSQSKISAAYGGVGVIDIVSILGARNQGLGKILRANVHFRAVSGNYKSFANKAQCCMTRIGNY